MRLTLGVPDPKGFYSWTLAEEFGRRVDSLSDGSIQVEVVRGDEVRSWNQVIAERTQGGDLDLALVPAQSWDVLGVTSMTALYVPFLVRDEEHLDAVATSDVADALLGGLDESGVTALALLPGGMRHLFAEAEPQVRPADLAGAGLRSPRSETTWAMWEALGAEPDDPNGGLEVAEEVSAGTITVLDSMFAFADGTFGSPATAGDVAPYPLAFTLVANDRSLEQLSSAQRDALRDAGHETAAWAASSRLSDAEEARLLCERAPKARVVLAGHDVVEQWRSATADFAARLRADPQVDAVAAEIEQLATQTDPAAAVQACTGRDFGTDGSPTPNATSSPPPNVPTEFPEGVYRKELTAEELMAAGVNVADAHGHAGVWTLTLRDGRLGPEDDEECPGSTYGIIDGRVVVTLGPEGPGCGEAAGEVLFSAGWALEGDQMLFTDVRSGHGSDVLIAGIFGTAPWTKLE